jgi:hypothetical protein
MIAVDEQNRFLQDLDPNVAPEDLTPLPAGAHRAQAGLKA